MPSTSSGSTPNTGARCTCPEGLGHAFLALEDNSTLTYLCSTGYAPGREHGINPVDPGLGLPLPEGVDFLLSDKDTAAPTLAAGRRVRAAADLGGLPGVRRRPRLSTLSRNR